MNRNLKHASFASAFNSSSIFGFPAETLYAAIAVVVIVVTVIAIVASVVVLRKKK